MTAPRAFSTLELSAVVAIVAVLASFAIPSFFGAQEQSHDLAAQANLELLANRAQDRLIRDRAYSYLVWGSSSAAAAVLADEEPGMAHLLVPLTAAERNVTVPGKIGVAADVNGNLVLATLSEGEQQRCFITILKPRTGFEVLYAPEAQENGECPGVHQDE